jgi:membrane protease YdiL (CAAX protease family)
VNETIDGLQISRQKGMATVVSGSCLFMAIIVLVNRAANGLFGEIMASGLRARVTVELTGAMVGEIILLVLLVLYLRRRPVSLRQIGLWLPSPLRGWIAAAVVTALLVWLNLTFLLRDAYNLTDFSLFRVYNALIAGIIAGLVEETLFRGFFMSELAWAGFGKPAQCIVSAILYGLVHSVWGITSGIYTMQFVGGAVIATGVFGALSSLVYLMSDRSLMPAIATHAVIDFFIEPWYYVLAVRFIQWYQMNP